MALSTSRMYKDIPQTVHHIQPSRIINGVIRTYTAFTSPHGTNVTEWLISFLNRISICGTGPKYGDDDCMIDLLDVDGDIIDEYVISKNAFNYARQLLDFKRLT